MPDPVKRRSYRSPARQRTARETRTRVLQAAERLFLEHGYARTTVAAVAEHAGVAQDTVFHVFGSKRGLLQQVLDVAVGGDDADVALLDRPGPQALRAETDQRRQVAAFAHGILLQLERLRPVDDVLRSAAAVDPQVATLREDLQLRQRRQAMGVVAGWIAANGPLRGGLPVDEAATVLWTLTSPEVHRLLRVDSGWAPERYERWLRETLEQTLLG